MAIIRRSRVLRAVLIDASKSMQPKLAGAAVCALTLLSGFAATDAQATTTAIGALAGAGGVSATGAATYTIPINVPPGTHGMQPSLALVYNSQGGDGYAGYGWTLSGFSTITRCPQTVADDGAAAPVLYVSTDDYCLDGQRLIVTSGNPGSGTAYYETQIKDFAQITSFSGSSTFGGPGYFTVATKDGRVYEYGNTSDSQIVAEGTAKVRAWALDKVTDGSGDYMEYAYGSSTTAGRQFYPISIDYTRNGSAAADHTIQFDYSARPSTSVITSYVDGSIIVNSKLLSDIKIFYSTNTTPTFTYNLSYDQDSVSGRSRLLSVNECGNDGSCLPATTITWKDAQAGWNTAQSTGVTLDDGTLAASAHLMDVDGDGLDDLVYPDDSTGDWMVLFGAAAGGFISSPVDTGDFYTTTTYMYAVVMDYDGDGKADLVQPISTGGWQVLTSTGARTSGAGGIFTRPANNIPDLSGNNSVTGQPIYAGQVWSADVTGDGVSDLLDANGAHVQRNINSGPPYPQTFTSGNVYADSGLTKKTNVVFQDAGTDFDGSGRVGGLVLKTSGSPATYTWTALTLSGSSLVALGTVTGDGSTLGATPFDSNGDGVTDLLTPSASGYWQVSISTGSTSTGFVSPLASTATVNTSLDPFAADYYGNGTQVALVYDNSASAWKALDTNFSSGSFTLSTTAITTPPFIGSGGGSYWQGSLRIGHIQAAGLDDLVFSAKAALSSAWTFYYSLHKINSGSNPAPDRVTQVTDGFGNYCQFQYSSLAGASTSLYTPGTGDDYPTQHIQPAMQVVSQYTESDGIGGSYSFSYAYTDAEADATGRGFLGFATRTITDGRNGSNNKETITYDQAFPYTGMVTQDVLKDSGSHRIWEIDNSGADQITSGTGHSTRYFPFFDSSVRHDYDNLGGSNHEIRTTTTTLSSSSFDSYGNQTAGSTTVVDDVASGSPTFTTTTAATYATAGSGYCVGAPSSVTVTNAVPADTLGATFSNNTSRNVAISQDTTNCRSNSQAVSSPVSGTATVTTAYNSYDAWGNATQTEVTGTGVDRLTDYDFSGGSNTNKEFPTSVTVHPTGLLSLTSSATWYYDYGLMHTSTDPNGQVTTLAYDAYGRLIQSTRPDGSYSTFTYSLCSVTPCGVTNGVYMVTVSQTASGLTTIVSGYTVYDSRGRVVKQGHTLLGGVDSRVTMTYDQMGNMLTRTQPHFSGATAVTTTYTYDPARNRLTNIDAPPAENDTCSSSCDETAFTFDGFTTTATHTVSNHATSSGTQATGRTLDALGRVSSMQDANSNTTLYEYDAFGDLVATQAPAGQDTVAHVTLMSYDGLGNKTGMVDPNMGTWSYAVDALGEITCQTDADGQSIGMGYDDVGRLTSKLETATGGCAGTPVASGTWTYDTTNGLGMLAEVSNTVSGSGAYVRDYAYDSLSRPSDVTTTIGTTPYTVSTTYDAFSRVSTVTYPESVTPTTPGTAPTANAGSDSAINLGATATLDGSGSSPITSTLQFQWSQTGGPVMLPLGSFDQAAESPTVTPTVAGTYTFQLQVIDSSTSLSSADSVTVTVKPLAPSSAPTVSPNPSTDGNVTVSWSAGTGASTYVLYRSTTVGGTYSQVYSGITGTSKGDTGLSNGTYYYKVASTANGVTGDQTSHSSVLNVTLPPGHPTGMQVLPPFQAPSTNYTVSWTAPTTGTVTSYNLLEDDNSSFTSPTTIVVTATSKTRSKTTAGTYYYKVQACNGTACNGTFSGVDHVVVEAVPLAPTMNTPSPSTISSGDNSTLSWTKHSGDTVTFYNEQVSLSGTFTGSGTNIGNVTSLVVHPTVTKYYRVQACNDVDCGPWSNTTSVTVDFGDDLQGGSGDGSDDGSGDDTGGDLGVRQVQDPVAGPEMLATTFLMPGGPDTEAPEIVAPMLDVPSASLERIASPVLAAPASAFEALDALQRARQTLVAGQPMQASESVLQARVSGIQRVPQDIALDRHARPVAGQLAYAPPVYAAYAGARHETVGGSPFRFTVQYAYDASSGAMQAVANADTGFIYWRAATDSGSAPVDAFGHLLAYTDGNNVSTVSAFDSVTGAVNGISTGIGSSTSVQQLVYAWDNFGNLKQRCDVNQGLTESFGYDALNRITASTVSTGASSCSGGTASGNPAITMAYDAVGNITGRTNTGIIVGGLALNDTYTYGDSSHPYAVTGVTSISGTYVYDANGNMTSGNGRTITWNVDNLPLTITSSSTVNGNNAVTGSSAFSYSPDLQRYHQVATDSNGTTTTDYVGGLFEVVTNSSDTEFRHSIMAAGGVIAVHTLYASDGHARTSYIHSDHLGSSDAITDDTGAVAQVMSFDAFGLRRSPTDWSYSGLNTAGIIGTTPTNGLKSITDRGFTNQEQLDSVGLVHMNGRVYDPGIGRFISADPTIPNPLYSQAFNRYAYVYNRPLRLTDPSGFCGGDPNNLANCQEADGTTPVALYWGSGAPPPEATPANGTSMELGCSGCDKAAPLPATNVSAPPPGGTDENGKGTGTVAPAPGTGAGKLPLVAAPPPPCTYCGNNDASGAARDAGEGFVKGGLGFGFISGSPSVHGTTYQDSGGIGAGSGFGHYGPGPNNGSAGRHSPGAVGPAPGRNTDPGSGYGIFAPGTPTAGKFIISGEFILGGPAAAGGATWRVYSTLKAANHVANALKVGEAIEAGEDIVTLFEVSDLMGQALVGAALLGGPAIIIGAVAGLVIYGGYELYEHEVAAPQSVILNSQGP